MQQRQGYQAVEKLRETLDEKYLWEVILLYAGESFKTYTGLPFTYEVRKGRNGDYTRELQIDALSGATITTNAMTNGVNAG